MIINVRKRVGAVLVTANKHHNLIGVLTQLVSTYLGTQTKRVVLL